MSLVAEIISRLTPDADAAFAIVEGAAEFASINGVPTAMPAAYVMTLREASAENQRMTGPVLQLCAADVAIVIITNNVSDVVGGAVTADIESLKTWVRARLIGFETPASANPLEHVSGEMLKAKNGTVWHEEVFAAAIYLTEEGTDNG